MKEFLPFQSFLNEKEAAPIIGVLKENGVNYKIETLKEPLDATIAGEIVQNKIFLLLQSQDFPRANEVLDNAILTNLSTLDDDYYLFSFSDEELNDIIQKPDEWSRQDFLIARKILAERGVNMSDEKINTLKSDRLKELSRQEVGDKWWIIIGYLLALVGGIMAIIIALPFILGKKTLPDGSRIFIYSSKTREHGKIILVVTGLVIITNALFFPGALILAFFGFIGHRF